MCARSTYNLLWYREVALVRTPKYTEAPVTLVHVCELNGGGEERVAEPVRTGVDGCAYHMGTSHHTARHTPQHAPQHTHTCTCNPLPSVVHSIREEEVGLTGLREWSAVQHEALGPLVLEDRQREVIQSVALPNKGVVVWHQPVWSSAVVWSMVGPWTNSTHVVTHTHELCIAVHVRKGSSDSLGVCEHVPEHVAVWRRPPKHPGQVTPPSLSI